MTQQELYEIFEDTIRNGKVDELRTMNLQSRFPSWQSEFGHYQNIRNAIVLQLKLKDKTPDFKAITGDLGANYFGDQGNSTPGIKFSLQSIVFKVAAVILLMIAFTVGLYFYSASQYSNEAILADVILTENTVSRSVKAPVDVNKIKAAFADKNYNQVIDLLEGQDLVTLGKPDYFLILGASYYHTGQYNMAIETYRTFIDADAIYLDEAYMNIIRCYLVQNNEVDALLTAEEALNNPEITDADAFNDVKRRLNNPLRKIFLK